MTKGLITAEQLQEAWIALRSLPSLKSHLNSLDDIVSISFHHKDDRYSDSGRFTLNEKNAVAAIREATAAALKLHIAKLEKMLIDLGVSLPK